ncbi:MAG: hypothetical protein CVU65_11425 [Deltaproteobacteria bacterium HGW-Deltaproteobacteria-22]|jgi:hypothetical protein|nr:MAG: hypothetical protein CVU65_11425 [Deltaproteobacteria bacterium HGW-Deltaproteobacteria-22]
MKRARLIALGLFVSGWVGCTTEQRQADGVNPREELFLLFPRMEKRLVLMVPGTELRTDFGLDYDGPAGDLSLTVEGADQSAWKGTRLAGSNMRLVVCGVPSMGKPITIVMKNHQTSSRLAALRIAAHKSDMCTPMSPVMDEYWADLGLHFGAPVGTPVGSPP